VQEIGHWGTRQSGHNEGGASNYTGVNNQEQGRQSQEMQGTRVHERQGLQNKTHKLWIMKVHPLTTAANIHH